MNSAKVTATPIKPSRRKSPRRLVVHDTANVASYYFSLMALACTTVMLSVYHIYAQRFLDQNGDVIMFRLTVALTVMATVVAMIGTAGAYMRRLFTIRLAITLQVLTIFLLVMILLLLVRSPPALSDTLVDRRWDSLSDAEMGSFQTSHKCMDGVKGISPDSVTCRNTFKQSLLWRVSYLHWFVALTLAAQVVNVVTGYITVKTVHKWRFVQASSAAAATAST
uniref:Tetraspanin n=1 Tax=Spongospora subterranea TaxID=70186 RepID=A0A0H5QQ04_9EUKA|eukprot:CRZ04169.1 hypothetical protein [Spongospora subterranea]